MIPVEPCWQSEELALQISWELGQWAGEQGCVIAPLSLLRALWWMTVSEVWSVEEREQ